MSFLVVLLLIAAVQSAYGECNLTKWEIWKSELYTGELSTDPDFWRYQTKTDVIFLTNFLALELAVSACVNHFDLLFFYLAGRMGPVDLQHSYKTMCRTECLESDAIHQAALEYSGCSCLELSTQESDRSFHIEGDFCLHNTARMLCDRVGYCGIWDCRIDDFMCPRYEWNKKSIPFKGPGTCIRGSAAKSGLHYSPIYIIMSITLLSAILVNYGVS